MAGVHMDIEEIIENFDLLDDWDDRYKYLIELGSTLEPLPEAAKIPENKVQGCVSQVWLTCSRSDESDPVLSFEADSDAHIVRGLIAIAFATFSGKRASEIMTTDEKQIFEKLGLTEHITPQRSNGLNSLVARIKAYASASVPA